MHTLAQMTGEIAVMSLIYAERFLDKTGCALHASNWRPIVLSALMLASKVYDDESMVNIDFCKITEIHLSDVNRLESEFLFHLGFNCTVRASQYAETYFRLRSARGENTTSFPLEPLTKTQSHRLEARSKRATRESKKDGARRQYQSVQVPGADDHVFGSREILS